MTPFPPPYKALPPSSQVVYLEGTDEVGREFEGSLTVPAGVFGVLTVWVWFNSIYIAFHFIRIDWLLHYPTNEFLGLRLFQIFFFTITNLPNLRVAFIKLVLYIHRTALKLTVKIFTVKNYSLLCMHLNSANKT